MPTDWDTRRRVFSPNTLLTPFHIETRSHTHACSPALKFILHLLLRYDFVHYSLILHSLLLFYTVISLLKICIYWLSYTNLLRLLTWYLSISLLVPCFPYAETSLIYHFRSLMDICSTNCKLIYYLPIPACKIKSIYLQINNMLFI